MLVQVGNAGEPVTIGMARDSGVSEAADVVFGLWRPALSEKATPEDKVCWKHYLIAKVLKVRNGESCQVFRMDWKPTWRFENVVQLDRETMEPMQGVPHNDMRIRTVSEAIEELSGGPWCSRWRSCSASRRPPPPRAHGSFGATLAPAGSFFALCGAGARLRPR
jgi:hypothetical protein